MKPSRKSGVKTLADVEPAPVGRIFLEIFRGVGLDMKVAFDDSVTDQEHE